MAGLTSLAEGRALALALALALAQAQTSPVMVRAIGTSPSRDVVAFLARNAIPRGLSTREEPWAREATAQEIAEHLCGSLQDGYLEEAARINQLGQLPAGDRPGESAYAFTWPACLGVSGPVQYTIQPRDNLTAIRLHVTGAYANDEGLRAFFANSGVTYDERRRLRHGTVLTLPFETLRTLIHVPTDQVENFARELRSVGGRTILVDESPAVVGRIIGPHRAGRIGTTEVQCTGGSEDDYPFNPIEVANAYGFISGPLDTVTIAVVDNGFFGVPCLQDGCPPIEGSGIRYSSRFPQALFAPREFYSSNYDRIGPRLYGTSFGPINYDGEPPLAINEVSGHGTHVASLLLGGPGFEQYRNLLMDRDRGRLNLSILAVARGTELLAPAADQNLDQYLNALSTPTIVNLSLTFDAELKPDTEALVGRAIRERPLTLFVAAAGNDAFNLDDGRYFPAALGGRDRDNVITVASLDGNGAISAFSNTGAQQVDIAAPGCRISGWIDAEGDEVPISGTSQAAPLVSFAAALLRTKWAFATPRRLKNRLIYSGNLLANEADRARISSQASLNIQQALFYNFDYVEFSGEAGVERLLGTITRFSGASCRNQNPQFDSIRSVKMLGERAFFYLSTEIGPVRVCEGRLAAMLPRNIPNIIFFDPSHRVEGGALVEIPQLDRRTREIRARDLIEYVRHQ